MQLDYQLLAFLIVLRFVAAFFYVYLRVNTHGFSGASPRANAG